jgi:glutaminyl-peptide cyclotransferase
MFVAAVLMLLMHLQQQIRISAKIRKNEVTKHSLIEVTPHDSDCYTQGLTYNDDFIYESCGINGRSSVRKVDPASGRVLQQLKLEQAIFAEGLVIVDNIIYVLTWQNKYMLVIDKKTLELLGKYSYRTHTGEGWGLTYDGQQFIVSDGSSRLSFFDVPDITKIHHKQLFHTQLKKTREIIVKDANGKEVNSLNELEWLGDGHVYSNVWYKDYILKINVADGSISEFLDLHSLYPYKTRSRNADCLNGIAHNATDNTLLVTGKLWPHYYKIKVSPVDEPKRERKTTSTSSRLINISNADSEDSS